MDAVKHLNFTHMVEKYGYANESSPVVKIMPKTQSLSLNSAKFPV